MRDSRAPSRCTDMLSRRHWPWQGSPIPWTTSYCSRCAPLGRTFLLSTHLTLVSLHSLCLETWPSCLCTPSAWNLLPMAESFCSRCKYAAHSSCLTSQSKVPYLPITRQPSSRSERTTPRWHRPRLSRSLYLPGLYSTRRVSGTQIPVKWVNTWILTSVCLVLFLSLTTYLGLGFFAF